MKSLTFLFIAVVPFHACAGVRGSPIGGPAAEPTTIACVTLFARSVTQRSSPSWGIPRSTAASWIRRGSRDVVTTEIFAKDELALRARVLRLERRVRVLLGIVRLLFVVVRLFGLRLDSQRVPSGETKSSILAAIERAKENMPVGVALRVLGL